MKRASIIFLSTLFCFIAISCKRNSEDGGVNSTKLSYGDSVFFIKDQNYVISPKWNKAGTYTAFPDNLLIDNTTGKITVAIIGHGLESQTGLRYKIKFQAAGTNELDSTYITIGGINYLDRIYNLSQNDSIISPLYNASISNNLPTGTYGIQADNKLGINSINGQININECIRRGLFNRPVENGEWEEVTITYKSNDNSNGATNRIDIALYYYDRMSDIPSNISTVMRAHQSMVLGVDQTAIPVTTGPIDTDLPDNLAISKPRPPCIIIVGQ